MTALMLLKKKKPTRKAKKVKPTHVPSTQRRHSAKLAVFGRPAK
jgi:hypothetical protein